MLVTRHEGDTFTSGQRKQVIVARVDRSDRGRRFGIRHDFGRLAEDEHEVIGVGRSDPVPNSRIGERSPELNKERVADDELELAGEPQLDEPCGRARSRDQSRDENVRVEDGPHALRAAPLVLRLDREP